MRLLKGALSILLLTVLFLASCKKETRDEQGIQPGLQNNIPMAKAGLSKAQIEKLRQLRASLPPGVEKRMKIKVSKLLKSDPQYRDLVRRALNAAAPACDANTQIMLWLNDQLSDWDDQIIFFAVVTGMLDFPMYDALLFENSSSNQHFGVKGEFTHSVTKTFKDLKRFWNIVSNDIVLVGFHGSMLQDRERVVRIDLILFEDDTPEDAEFFADLILQLLDVFPQYRMGNHPIFTFNAFSNSSFNFPPFGIVPNKIIMGDGIMQGFAAIGLGDVAPQAILAHEFGHQIQNQLNIASGTSPEASRHRELMADAYSAYYLSHSRGASMQWKRVKLFLQVFFNIGDCSVSDIGHHGTPTQRMAAAEWAYSVANNAQKQGHILTARQFTALFEAKFPQLLAR